MTIAAAKLTQIIRGDLFKRKIADDEEVGAFSKDLDVSPTIKLPRHESLMRNAQNLSDAFRITLFNSRNSQSKQNQKAESNKALSVTEFPAPEVQQFDEKQKNNVRKQTERIPDYARIGSLALKRAFLRQSSQKDRDKILQKASGLKEALISVSQKHASKLEVAKNKIDLSSLDGEAYVKAKVENYLKGLVNSIIKNTCLILL